MTFAGTTLAMGVWLKIASFHAYTTAALPVYLTYVDGVSK
jgi:hypothetical protein